jgi:hypothetical protein
MPMDLAELAAAIGRAAKEQNPEAYGDWPDAELGAQLLVQQQGQVHALFQSSNEKDPQGNAVVRTVFKGENEKDPQGNAVVQPDAERGPQAAWSKAQSIGAPGLGEHYTPPTSNEILASDNPFKAIIEKLMGGGRPKSVAAADPYGIDAWLAGKGPMPAFMGTTADVEPGVAVVKGSRLGGRVLGSLAKTIKPGETAGVYTLRDPVIERLQDLYRLGTSLPSVSNWAGSTSEELVKAFGGDREAALRWARMWGATSPNTSVPVNTRESISALIHALENPGVPFTEELAQNLPDAKITMAGSKFGNLNAALEGRVLSPDMKAEAMAGYMAGEPRLPIDVHALYALGSKATKFDPEISALRALMTKAEGLPARGGLTNPQIYRRYEDALRGTLQEFEPTRSVNQVFGELWEGARAHKGLKPQGGPIDILRQKGLLELGAMLDPDRLRAALRQSGWTAGAIAGFMATLDGTPAADGASADAGT